MRIYTLRCQMQAPVSMQEAFAVFEEPRNLVRITPEWLNFRLLTPNVVMSKGAELEYALRWMKAPLRWKTLITEYEPPFFFTDEMVRGPYALWQHRHIFHPSEEGAVMTDEVDYALPLGRLGRLVHRLIVANQLKAIFRYRQIAINQILCGGRARWTEPTITEKPPRNPPAGTANRETHTHAV